MQENLPLVYFHGLLPGKYVATWPVFIVGDRPEALSFSVAVDDAEHLGLSPSCAASTLRHAIQGLHGQRIILPRMREQHPSVERLATRYERFLELATAP